MRADAVLVRSDVKRRAKTEKTWSELALADLFTERDMVARLRKRLPILA